MAGDYYAFSLPAPLNDGSSSIYLMPLGATNETRLLKSDIHNVSITVRISHEVQSTETQQNVTEIQQTFKVCKLVEKKAGKH
ncbi:unnamed protein product [Gongylonema pulchrum]|uniref:Uncharacterized protein n=1 Tax=Gongylonema pulchrum TaxID=637853 RepID=A0A183DHW0_9BILA|nr:unnamed protein product [Gongylonema pulchrum]